MYEFTSNSKDSYTTLVSPFFTSYSIHLYSGIEPQLSHDGVDDLVLRVEEEVGEELVDYIRTIKNYVSNYITYT